MSGLLRDAQLSGATESFKFDDRVELFKAAVRLMMCLDHGGNHHFAVTDEGYTLWCSRSGAVCAELVDG